MKNNAHKTAIARKKLSGPMKWLIAKGYIKKGDSGLDYGCGKGFDADHLGFAGFDPHHRPEMPEGQFDFVTCNYVLNVIEDPQERVNVENILIERSTKMTFVAVRNDIKALNGYTKIGTWQGIVSPSNEGWELITSNGKFKLWAYTH